jgi:hypothetical protein
MDEVSVMLETQKYMEIVRSRGERKLLLNRVYRECHHKIHAGTYDGPKLN